MEIIKKQKRKFTSLYKARIAIEALSGSLSIPELMEKFDLNRKQILNWKEILISKAYLVFEKEDSENNNTLEKEQDGYINELQRFSEKKKSND